MQRLLQRAVINLLWVLVLVSLLLVCCQSKLIYHPRGYSVTDLATVDAAPLSYTTSQGKQVAWLSPKQRTEAEHVWLVFCGNATMALDFAGYFDAESLKHDRFVLFDYPAYGSCEGRPTPNSIRESIKALLPALAAKLNTTPEALRPKLRVFGHSLGCAAALMAMEEHSINQGVLVSPFTRMMDMSRQTVGWPLCCLLHHRFDNVAALERLKGRGTMHLQVFHGTDDEVIPVAMSQELSQRFPQMLTFTPVAGAHHNDIISTSREAIIGAMK